MAIQAPSQLPLALAHPPQYGRDSFLPGRSNRAALALVERWPDWPAPIALLSGPAGSGKTHLAHIWAERSGARLMAATDLAFPGRVQLARGEWIAMEDVAPDDVPEAELFHLINSARESGAGLLITSRAAAPSWRIALSDLRSRLRLAAPAALEAPDEDLLRQVLVKLFADRQLVVERPVIDYLLVRMERSLSAAGQLVEALDREALAQAGPITRPMAARILSAAADSAAEFAVRK